MDHPDVPAKSFARAERANCVGAAANPSTSTLRPRDIHASAARRWRPPCRGRQRGRLVVFPPPRLFPRKDGLYKPLTPSLCTHHPFKVQQQQRVSLRHSAWSTLHLRARRRARSTRRQAQPSMPPPPLPLLSSLLLSQRQCSSTKHIFQTLLPGSLLLLLLCPPS